MTPPGAVISAATSAQALQRGRKGKSLLQDPHLGGKEEAYHRDVIVRRDKQYQHLTVGTPGGTHLLFHPHLPPQAIEPAREQPPFVPPHDVSAPSPCRIGQRHLAVPFPPSGPFRGAGERQRAVGQLGPNFRVCCRSGTDLDSFI